MMSDERIQDTSSTEESSEERLAIMASRGYGPTEASQFLADGETFEWREQAGSMLIDRITEHEAHLKWQKLSDEIGIPDASSSTDRETPEKLAQLLGSVRDVLGNRAYIIGTHTDALALANAVIAAGYRSVGSDHE